MINPNINKNFWVGAGIVVGGVILIIITDGAATPLLAL